MEQIIDALTKGGAVAALVLVCYGFINGLVFGKPTVQAMLASKDAELATKDRECEAANKRADEWRARAEIWEKRSFDMAERLTHSIDALEQATAYLMRMGGND